jgi:hypothetical protein
MSLFVAIAVFAVLAYALHRTVQIGKRPLGMPPGPPTVPLFGNNLQVCLRFIPWFASQGEY